MLASGLVVFCKLALSGLPVAPLQILFNGRDSWASGTSTRLKLLAGSR